MDKLKNTAVVIEVFEKTAETSIKDALFETEGKISHLERQTIFLVPTEIFGEI